MRPQVREDVELSIEAAPKIASMYHLSPYVWREREVYAMLVRVVNRSDVAAAKVARIHFGTSTDGLHFRIDDEPVLAPGPELADHDGCEDPTVVQCEDQYYVYYTGWNERRKEANLLFATGPDPRSLRKRGIVLSSQPLFRNPKEATVLAARFGWRMFFEYSRDNRSWIGIAGSAALDGPWEILPLSFPGTTRGWDGGMLSPGPVVRTGDHWIMFYNGALDDDHWKIGSVVFDETPNVLCQSDAPIVCAQRPAPEPGGRVMAFASSAVVCDSSTLWLYYSVGDMQMRRATIVLQNYKLTPSGLMR